MTNRERFEKWASSPPFEWSIERYSKMGSWPGNYRSYHVQCAWCAWQDAVAECTRIAASPEYRP